MYIYKLFSLNDPENIVYVGQTTKTLSQRLASHKSDSKKEKRLICEWIREQNFKVGISLIEKVKGSMEDLDRREIYWISVFREKYELLNILKGGRGINYGLFGDKNGNAKKIIQYDLNGQFIEIFNSMVDASEKTKVKINLISGCCCLDRVNTAGGFIWKYYSENYSEKIVSIKEINDNIKQTAKKNYGDIILQYALDGVLIREWQTMRDIERELSFKRAGIYYTLRHTGIAYGYKWVCANKEIINIPLKGPKLNFKKVLQYDLQGNFIKEWNGFIYALRSLCINSSTISNVLDKPKTCGGFQWRSWKENPPLIIESFVDKRKIKWLYRPGIRKKHHLKN